MGALGSGWLYSLHILQNAKGDLKELSQFIREESVIERQFIGVKHLCFASKARFIICSSLKVN